MTKTVQKMHDEAQAPLTPMVIEGNAGGDFLSMLANAVRDPACDVNKMRALLDMKRDLEREVAERAFNEALNEVQGKVGHVATDASNPSTRSRYASYAALDKALRPIYTASGFSLSFDTGEAPENYVRVIGYVSHRAGHTRTYNALMPADGKGAKGGEVMTRTHAAGSAMSYGMRYLLKLIFNVAIGENDDDGNAAGATPISEEQVAKLRQAINDFDFDEAKIAEFAGVKTLEEIPSDWHGRVVAAINEKAKAKRK